MPDYHLGGRDNSEVLAMPVSEAEESSVAARRARRPRTLTEALGDTAAAGEQRNSVSVSAGPASG